MLHVINQLGGAGGAEQGLVREATHFGPGVEQVVVRLFEGDDLEPQLISHGVTAVPLGLSAARSAWSWPLAAWKVHRLLRRHRPDVVHTSLFVGNLVGQLAAWPGRVPVVSSLTLSGDPELHRRLQPGANTIHAAMLRSIAGFVGRRGRVRYRALTEDTKRTSCASLRIPESRVTVIPRGVPQRFSGATADRARFGLPDRVPVFVNVGRQTAQKGHLLLLDAFEQIRGRLETARLCILGREGEGTPGLRAAIAARGLEESVHLLGYRTDGDVLLASADVFLFSSLAEGLGTTVLEAMGAGLPVVAFDIPPVREVTGGGTVARLVAVGDTHALATTAVALLDPAIGGPLGDAAQRWVEERYAIEAVAARVVALLGEAAAEGA